MTCTTIKHGIALFLLLGSLLGSRVSVWAAISQACEDSGAAITSNADLLAAAPFGTCDIYVDQSKSCTFDFNTISGDYESICTSLGGNFYEEDISLQCKVTLQGQSYDVTYNYLNYPACFGMNCTDAEAMEAYDTIVFPTFESQLATQGFTCDVSAAVHGALSFVVVVFLSIAAIATFM